MKKILILSNSFGGLYSFRYELVHYLSIKYEVIISAPYHKKISEFEKIGCKIIVTKINRRSKNIIQDLDIFKYYKDIMIGNNIDLVLTYTVKPNIYGGLACQKLNIPYISNITGLGTTIEDGGLQSKLLLKLYRFGLKKAEYIFFQNSNNLELFKKKVFKNNDNFILIPGSGVNLEKFKLETRDGNANKFLFIGRLMKNKGIYEYLNAVKEVKSQYPNTSFSILGSYEENIEDIILEMEGNGLIRYHGSGKEVRPYLNNVDCLINPSYHEGMSNVLLEAAATGLPLLASDIPGCKEIVDEGKNGFLFLPKDSQSLVNSIIKFIHLTDSERKKMGLYSRKKVEKEFDRNIVIDKYDEVIKDILGEN